MLNVVHKEKKPCQSRLTLKSDHCTVERLSQNLWKDGVLKRWTDFFSTLSGCLLLCVHCLETTMAWLHHVHTTTTYHGWMMIVSHHDNGRVWPLLKLGPYTNLNDMCKTSAQLLLLSYGLREGIEKRESKILYWIRPPSRHAFLD